jgi:hypothetical protein
MSPCAVLEIVLFSDRYSLCDLVAQGFEVTISGDGGSTIITGFPPASILQRLDRAECIAQSTGDYSVRGGRGA